MHIRKIELQGFKSFVDRQTFHFGKGIAGVVGPNGCGKSNIVDAIRWCIGEQSAKSLRGSAMQDVIFNGSAVRKPVGMAEVVITFAREGDDPFPGEYARFEEVRVGRRLFRDGNSEYLLNQEKVRRRDVVDFFMDTGVGNKLYSFIQQGEIGRIVQAKPEERRSLIEEAAGISKYKARRDEAESKLDATGQNLDRATDLAEEMGRRLRVLERQVDKAAKYRRLRAQVRQGELFLGLVKYSGLVGERRELNGELRASRDLAARLARELERKDGDLKLNREEITVMSAVVARLRDEVAELEAQRREKESARHFQAKEQVELRSRLGVLAHDLEDARAQLARATEDATAAELELSEAAATLAAHDGSLAEREQRAAELGRELVSRRELVERLKREVMACITGLVRHRTSLNAVGQRRGDLTERQAQLQREGEGVTGDLTQMEEALEGALLTVEATELAYEEAKEMAEAAKAEQLEADSGVQSARRAVATAERARSDLDRAATKVETRLQALRDLASSHAGVEGGAKKVLAAVDTHGTLAEHLQVPEALEASLTAALGAALDAVILRDASQLAAAAQAAGSAGRTRLLIDDPDGALPSEGLAARVGGSDIGRRALARLLGVLHEAPDLSAALALAGAGAAAVTPSGELVSADGSVLVGRPEASAGAAILRRQRQLQALEIDHAERVVAAEAAASELDLARESLTEASAVVEALRRSGEQQRALVERARVALSEARLHQRERERELTAHRGRSAQLLAQQQRVAEQLQGLEGEAEAHSAAILRDEARQDTQEQELTHAQADLVRFEAAAAEARELFARSRSERGAARERVVLLEKSLRAAQERAADAQRRQERSDTETERAEARLVDLEQAQTQVVQEISVLLEQQGQLSAKLQAEKTRLARARDALGEAEEGLRGLRADVDAATSKAARLELKLQEARLSIEALREQLESRYQVSLPGLLDKLDRDAALILEAGEQANAPVPGRPQEPVPDLRLTPQLMQSPKAVKEWVERLETLRASLGRLGEVNLAALDEYEEVAERYEWLETQRIDLEQSVDTIRRAIAKINRTCRERFRETFDLVNEQFQKIYPALSGGGQGRLTLTDEDDLLETGVDIFVQPPGKRLQNLSLLSGGEKALCATGLIFALFKVKPSPFCVLDEVDAPLDEGNGARFNEVLREMSSLTQFIVITHVKKTMESVDILYGVTMPDPGVSRLVTVNVT